MFYRVFQDAVFKEPIVNKYWVGKFNDLKEELDLFLNKCKCLVKDLTGVG